MGYSELQHLQDKTTHVFPQGLLERLGHLPKKAGEQLVFLDFDDTLFDADSRYDIDPELRNHRGDNAYAYILSKFDSFAEFFKQLDPDAHIFTNTDDFYNPGNPNHVILTAGNINFQNQKIRATRFAHAKKILVQDSKRKPEVMLQYLLTLGYIPGEIHFYDDRIQNFEGVDEVMSQELGIPVIFHKVTPREGRKSVDIEITSKSKLDDILSGK